MHVHIVSMCEGECACVLACVRACVCLSTALLGYIALTASKKVTLLLYGLILVCEEQCMTLGDSAHHVMHTPQSN